MQSLIGESHFIAPFDVQSSQHSSDISFGKGEQEVIDKCALLKLLSAVLSSSNFRMNCMVHSL